MAATNPAHLSREYSEKPVLKFIFYTVIIAFLIYGWLQRDNSNLSASDGLGYLLGILGGSAMLLLLVYPMRKKMRFMHGWGKIKHWFRLHMILGILGPVMILFHSNFSLGSTNSNLALFSMLIVAGSGLVGRYIYARIHFGVYGQQATLKEIRDNLQITKGKLGDSFNLSSSIVKAIRKTEKRLLKKRNHIISLILLPFIPAYTKLCIISISHKIKKDIHKQAKKNNWDRNTRARFTKDSTSLLRFYIKNLRRASELSTYRQLFSLWHLLHFPLFITLVLCGIAHVIAVHIF